MGGGDEGGVAIVGSPCLRCGETGIQERRAAQGCVALQIEVSNKGHVLNHAREFIIPLVFFLLCNLTLECHDGAFF